MTQPDPTPPAPKADAPVLVAIRFPTPLHVHGMEMVEIWKVDAKHPAIVQGGSVFLLDRTTLAEVPRSFCVLRYQVPEGMSIGDAVAKISKGGK